LGLLKRLFKSVGWLLLALVTTSLLLVLALRWVNPPTTAVIAAWQLESGRRARQVWQPLERISPHLQMAVIAAEDQKFPDHHGFDIDSIRRALNEERPRPRGASTITQQVAKNLFLWHGRSYLRKGIEAWFAVLMEMLWPKQRILEMYLNIAEFGEGVYGAEAAARIFYGRSAQRLSAWQAGLLAAVLPNPKQMSAARPSGYVRSRATKINEMVRKLGGARYLGRLSG
jgi:monofunctional biosynthetic peptidoglycan transglycosylase